MVGTEDSVSASVAEGKGKLIDAVGGLKVSSEQDECARQHIVQFADLPATILLQRL
jgi:hydroxymethylglutaryl-CoA reductase